VPVVLVDDGDHQVVVAEAAAETIGGERAARAAPEDHDVASHACTDPFAVVGSVRTRIRS